jgi:hypothetical protein
MHGMVLPVGCMVHMLSLEVRSMTWTRTPGADEMGRFQQSWMRWYNLRVKNDSHERNSTA